MGGCNIVILSSGLGLYPIPRDIIMSTLGAYLRVFGEQTALLLIYFVFASKR